MHEPKEKFHNGMEINQLRIIDKAIELLCTIHGKEMHTIQPNFLRNIQKITAPETVIIGRKRTRHL